MTTRDYVMCIQCAMEQILRGEPVHGFDEDPQTHFKQHHPDATATLARRKELEAELLRRFDSAEKAAGN